MVSRALSMAALLSSSLLAAQEIPLTNWTVPSYRATSASGGLTTMTDITPGVGFVGVAPCRLVDTRLAGFPAGYGPPSLTQGVPRNFDLNSDPQCPGIPAGIDAYSLNVTVTNTQGPGFILIYPQGGSQPTVSTVNYVAGQTIANAAIVPAGTSGGVTVVAGVSGTDLVIDINGYFTDQYNPGVSFHALSTTAGDAIFAENTYGVFGGNGVHGKSLNGYGVFGESVNNNGVVATSSAPGNAAVWAANGNSADGSTGVLGWANNPANSGRTYGVYGQTNSAASAAAGVFGVDGTGVTSEHGVFISAGVRGESHSQNGVLGITENGFAGNGVGGRIAGTGVFGFLGFEGLTDYGVYSDGPAKVTGNLTVNGTFSSANKYFIQPHPFDAAKEIRYVSLEGPHAEVYFRGTAQISRGVTRIDIPQDFVMVADGRTYSAVVTPFGGMATVAVLSQGPDGVILQASRDVKVNYVVYAERSAIKNPEPIVENVDFRPGRDQDALAYVPDSYLRLLIQNGTLNPDGTLNMETARRLGWDKEWEKRNPPVALPAPE